MVELTLISYNVKTSFPGCHDCDVVSRPDFFPDGNDKRLVGGLLFFFFGKYKRKNYLAKNKGFILIINTT